MADSTKHEVDAATRAQVAEFLRMTPAERLRSLVNTVTFIERARVGIRQAERQRALDRAALPVLHEVLRQLREHK